jgi:hypothetical protein
MKVCIHMEFGEGDWTTYDHIVLSGETIEDIRRQAAQAIEKRKPAHYWSEELEAHA